MEFLVDTEDDTWKDLAFYSEDHKHSQWADRLVAMIIEGVQQRVLGTGYQANGCTIYQAKGGIDAAANDRSCVGGCYPVPHDGQLSALIQDHSESWPSAQTHMPFTYHSFFLASDFGWSLILLPAGFQSSVLGSIWYRVSVVLGLRILLTVDFAHTHKAPIVPYVIPIA